MLGTQFYHGLTEKFTSIFGTLFNDIYISKYDANGNEIQKAKVPLSYGPREKFLARNVAEDQELTSDPGQKKKVALRLPRMSFELIDISYDAQRKQSTKLQLKSSTESENKRIKKSVYVPVPYNFIYQLNILTKTVEDGLKIVEQIIPFFTPDFTVTANLIPDFQNYDIAVELQEVSTSDSYEGDFKERRAIIWTMVFSLKGFLFGPVSNTGLIKIVNVDIKDGVKYERITVQPGLTANGEPTTSLSNTISYFNINEDDNYDYIVTVTNPDVD